MHPFPPLRLRFLLAAAADKVALQLQLFVCFIYDIYLPLQLVSVARQKGDQLLMRCKKVVVYYII